MSKLLIVGSVALDSIATPAGKVTDALGGSAVYSSLSASYFAPVNFVGVVGTDYPKAAETMLKKHGVDLAGLEKEEGKTFRWSGEYGAEFGDATTLETHLNVFEHFDPKIPAAYAKTPYVFLANIHPALQMKVLDAVKKPKLTVLDSMNLWINIAKEDLLKLIKRVDVFVLNESEAKMLTGEGNTAKAAAWIMSRGPKTVVIKKGANGVVLFNAKYRIALPAYFLESIKDPTGAGDTFAGAFAGFLADQGKTDLRTIKRALAYGTIMASFTVQDFSVKALAGLKKSDITKRYKDYLKLTQIES